MCLDQQFPTLRLPYATQWQKNAACALDIILFWAFAMMIFWQLERKKNILAKNVKKFPLTEGILCTTGSYKLPGLSQSSQT
jgi:hypothetical protein